MKTVIRIIASPFVFCIQFIWLTFCCFKNTFLFIKHGGEWITYNDDYTKATMYRIFEELKKHSEAK